MASRRITFQFHTLMGELEELRHGTRSLMNAIDGFREVRRQKGIELDVEEGIYERAIYGSARRTLKGCLRVLDSWDEMNEEEQDERRDEVLEMIEGMRTWNAGQGSGKVN